MAFAELDRSRGRVAFRTPRVAHQFLNTLVEAVSARSGYPNGVHVFPDGSLNGVPIDSRHMFTEANFENRDGTSYAKLELSSLANKPEKFCDLLVATPPLFGSLGGRTRPDEIIERLVGLARLLSEDGVGVSMAPPFYRTFGAGRLDVALSACGIYVHAIVNTPPRFFWPYTSIQPIFVIVSRRRTETVAALDCTNFEDLSLQIENVLSHFDTGDLHSGIEVNLKEFRGFEHWYAQKEIDSLEGDFTRYEKYKLRDVSLFINLVRTGGEFDDIPNSVYLPMIGNGAAVDSFDKLTMKHQNYAQVVVDTSKVKPEFLCSFLNTKHFRLYLEAEKLTRSQTPPRLNRDQVHHLPVAIPELDIQQQISKNIMKLGELRAMVEELAQNISVNPVSSTSMTQKVDEALAVFGRLNAEDHVISLLRQGESKTVEFKQTFSLDISDNSKKPHLETMVIKTIAGFLNSDGGDLLVGVSDDGQVVGIDYEIEKLHRALDDNFLKHFKNKFKERIGEQFYPRVSYDIVDVSGKSVFRVSCRPSDIEVFVDGKDFYVRTNPATDKLDGPKLLEYVKQRFHQPPVAVLG